MIGTVYNLALWLILPGVLAYHAYRSKSRNRPCAFAERFGSIPEADLEKIRGKRVIWVHAVSVGETIASFPLLKGLRARCPEHAIVVSNVTETGRSVALKSGLADLCIYLPFDYRFAVRRALGRVRPELIVLMETELWPNFIGAAADMGIPMLLANGRISDRSLRRYLKVAWFFRPILGRLSALCMQTGADAERITAIGAPAGRVHVAGNLKYDIPLVQADPAQVAALKAKFAVPAGPLVFTAASTHEGEEELVLDAYQELLAKSGDHFMILAPRHPERAAAVAELIGRRGLAFKRRSQLASGEELAERGQAPAEPVPSAPVPLAPGAVLLLDTVGELAGLYRVSDLVFVGGSLVPTGGHNPLEPAACGVPVLFGPHMENFREVAGLFVGCGAGIQLTDASGLGRELVALAADEVRRREIGAAGTGLIRDCSGATQRHLDRIVELLGGDGGGASAIGAGGFPLSPTLPRQGGGSDGATLARPAEGSDGATLPRLREGIVEAQGSDGADAPGDRT